MLTIQISVHIVRNWYTQFVHCACAHLTWRKATAEWLDFLHLTITTKDNQSIACCNINLHLPEHAQHFHSLFCAVSGKLLGVQCTFWPMQYNKIVRLILTSEQFFSGKSICRQKLCYENYHAASCKFLLHKQQEMHLK